MFNALRSNSAVLAAPAKIVEALMLSVQETQHLIETTFLTTTCRCEIDSHGVLTLYRSQKGTCFPARSIAQRSLAHLPNSRAVAELFYCSQEGEYRFRRITWPDLHPSSGQGLASDSSV